jgi:hypothetical protein
MPGLWYATVCSIGGATDCSTVGGSVCAVGGSA